MAASLLQLVPPEGEPAGDADEGLSVERMLAVYRSMVKVRLLDERMMKHQRQGRIGFYGACTGQEATPVAVAEALEDSDWIFPALREGVAMLHRGFPLVPYLCQVFGNRGDILKGRQMPSHYSAKQVNQVSWSSCIGNQLPQAVGAAMAARLKGDDTVVVGFMGDGATSSSDFHMAMNFAGVFQAPVVLVCQNNHWSISVPTTNQTASETLAVKAEAYGFPGVRVDGNDVLAVWRAAREAVERARKGEGPTFIESVTYRMGAHSSSDDPTRYRDPKEVEVWEGRDPIERYQRFLKQRGHLSDDKDEQMRGELADEIAAAVKEAEAMEPPAPESMFDDVYAKMPPHLAEQKREYMNFIRERDNDG